MGGRLTEAQVALLSSITGRRGIVWLLGEDAETAISMAGTRFIALGPSEGDAVPAMITEEGRDLLASTIGGPSS